MLALKVAFVFPLILLVILFLMRKKENAQKKQLELPECFSASKFERLKAVQCKFQPLISQEFY